MDDLATVATSLEAIERMFVISPPLAWAILAIHALGGSMLGMGVSRMGSVVEEIKRLAASVAELRENLAAHEERLQAKVVDLARLEGRMEELVGRQSQRRSSGGGGGG